MYKQPLKLLKQTDTTFKIKCICGCTIKSHYTGGIKREWEDHIFSNKCKKIDTPEILEFEKELYDEINRYEKGE